jgi:hypothetical protein
MAANSLGTGWLAKPVFCLIAGQQAGQPPEASGATTLIRHNAENPFLRYTGLTVAFA